LGVMCVVWGGFVGVGGGGGGEEGVDKVFCLHAECCQD